MTKRERERKITMFGMIGMSILLIGSLATASYAWFVRYPATVNSNEMTVVAPDDYSYYSYNGNVPWNDSPNGNFEHDFTRITNSNKSSLTSFSDFYPGQSKIYCLYAASRTVGNNLSLVLNSFISNNSTKEGLTQKRYLKDTDTEINVGWAIDITSMASSDGTGYYDSENPTTSWLAITNPSGSLTGDVFNETNVPTSTLNGADTTITLASPLTIFQGTTEQKNWTSAYIFYRVHLSNASTVLYSEYNTTDGTNIPPSTGNRQFYQNETDPRTSNCYAGLTFALSTMTLEF